LLVDSQGGVAQVVVVRADPPGYFEDTVRQTLGTWLFHPWPSGAGGSARCWVSTAVKFKLDGL
jgi:outer membrane biosynthesis protein TonB